METHSAHIEKIRHCWNYYFWDFKYCQSRIRFDEEIKTNYFGDILSYFITTYSCLKRLNHHSDSNDSIFQSIGVLQIIYVHQDLIDELLYIFKLEKSKREDKFPNREIRNKLVGHPISRGQKNELISSSFFGDEFQNGDIHYILYSKENNFKSQEIKYHLADIINRHDIFLEKYLTIILEKIEIILREFQNELVYLNEIVNSNLHFKKIVNLVSHKYERIFRENYLFNIEILERCFDKQDEHPRYKHIVTLFLNTLKEYLPESIINIEELFSDKYKDEFIESPKIILQYASQSENSESEVEKRNMRYEYQKLFEKHPVFGLRYFKNRFSNDVEILRELSNMEQNEEDVLEFYSSYEYLETLLKKRNLID